MNVVWFAATGMVGLALAGCHKETKSAPVDAGVDATALRVPAPNSLLAQELGADDAGRGTFRFFDDGPACGPAARVDRTAPTLGQFEGVMEFRSTQGPAPKQGDEDALSPIQLTISVADTVVRRNDPIDIKTTLTNRSKGSFTYQRAMDGSEAHWVSPFVDAYVIAPDGTQARWTFANSSARCGNLDPRLPTDFVTLKPGETREDPFGNYAKMLLHVSMWKLGTYKLWVIYSACQGPEMHGNGADDAPKPANLFEGTIVSNALTINVLPP